MNTLLACFYLACFQGCAVPAIVRIFRRRSSGDLSLWREAILITGASLQLIVMLRTGAAWQVWLSPCATILNLSVLSAVILRFRK